MNRRIASTMTAVALATVACRSTQTPPEPTPHAPVSVIPLPRHAELRADAWAPLDTVVIALADPTPELRALGALAADIARGSLDRPARVAEGGAPAQGIRIRLEPSPNADPESYDLQVQSTGVELSAPTGAGLFYGLQTLRQLAEAARPASAARARIVAGVSIADAPRFRYRGLHLDVGRHFSSVAFVKRYIDLMSRYKLNTFHWHLTEDQGWRIEIKAYPRLTEVGSCRAQTLVGRPSNTATFDGKPHCGFYTQDEIRDVIAYAAARYVTIIPEIEMPGHSKAAIVAYPDLACTPGPFEVRQTWGVDQDILCPSENTFRFVEDVLNEVTALFPGRYVHIGGDEAPKQRWRASPVAQAVIARERLKDENELQSYFIRRVEQMLLQRNKRLIGWDEILEGGLAPEATVMSWRGSAGGIAAAREGHDVIMTPNSHLYFDAYQGPQAFEPLAIGGNIPLDRVYSFEPVPDSLTAEQATHVLGAQANMWTEYLPTPESIEYMAYPRVLALAEVVWSPKASRQWTDFTMRLPDAFRALDRLGVNYRMPGVEGLGADRLTLTSRAAITLRTSVPDAEIRYTVDGTDPNRASRLYERPFYATASTEGTKVTARVFTRDGRMSAPSSSRVLRATYRAPAKVDASPLAPGLTFTYAEANLRNVRPIDTLPVVRQGVATSVSLQGGERPERFALKFTGFITVPKDGIYEFGISSDDGSTVMVGDTVVINNDGPRGPDEKTGAVALRKGPHAFVVRYFQGTGGLALSMRVRANNGPWTPIPKDWLSHSSR